MLAEVNMLKVRKLLSYHSESGSTDENTILRNNFNLKITPEVKVAFMRHCWKRWNYSFEENVEKWSFSKL